MHPGVGVGVKVGVGVGHAPLSFGNAADVHSAPPAPLSHDGVTVLIPHATASKETVRPPEVPWAIVLAASVPAIHVEIVVGDVEIFPVHTVVAPNLMLTKFLPAGQLDRKSTRLNSSHSRASRMPSSA